MGFYHPATLVKDGQRHGVAFLPDRRRAIDWRCTLEGQHRRPPSVRLGLRYVTGLRQEAARADCVAARPFASMADVAQRGATPRATSSRRSRTRARFAAFGLTRREALWQAAAVERDATSPAGAGPAAAPGRRRCRR